MGAYRRKHGKSESEISGMQRKGVSQDHLAGIIDCLLVTSCRLPSDATIEEAVSALLSAASERLLDTALGVRIVRDNGDPIVVSRSPRGRAGEASSPTRLFPEYAIERVASIEADYGSTLHIATDDETHFEEIDVLLSRLSLAVGGVLLRARAEERTKAQGAQIRRLRAQLIQLEKLASLGQIAAGVVHELNNPLTSIIAYSDFLLKKSQKTGGEPADIERLGRIQEAADRILGFSRDLIDYTRPTSEAHATLAIGDIINRALGFCEHVLDQSDVTVDRSFEDVPPTRGIAGQLTQVFVNLFTNAAHAMRGGGGRLQIAVSTAPSGREVTITISDEGHGIEVDHLSLIFEPFFTTKTDGTGTGLGLSIVRDIIERHGGRIRAESQASKGTIFTIDLPALDLDNDG